VATWQNDMQQNITQMTDTQYNNTITAKFHIKTHNRVAFNSGNRHFTTWHSTE